MTSCNDMLKELTATGLKISHGQFSLMGLPQPSWVQSDDIEVLIEDYPENVQIEVKFEHHKTLLKYGSDPETLLGMKQHCAKEWFPELELRFQRVAEYFDLQWGKFEEIEDVVVPIIIYALTGKFPAVQRERVFAALLEIRSVLSSDS